MYFFTEDINATYPELFDRRFTREQMTEVYRDVVDRSEYKYFEDWMYHMRRAGLVRQESYVSEKELETYAKRCSEKIVVRFWRDGNSRDMAREATEFERWILFKLIYAGLLEGNGKTEREQEIAASSVEFAANLMFENVYVGDGEARVNGYLSVYNKIVDYYQR